LHDGSQVAMTKAIEGGSKTAEGGKQGHDSRLTKTQPWRSLTRRSHGRLRHSKKTLGTEKAVLTDAFVRQQTLIDSRSQLAQGSVKSRFCWRSRVKN
jgi:hypothetical protein